MARASVISWDFTSKNGDLMGLTKKNGDLDV
jgi:hypothetical protein